MVPKRIHLLVKAGDVVKREARRPLAVRNVGRPVVYV